MEESLSTQVVESKNDYLIFFLKASLVYGTCFNPQIFKHQLICQFNLVDNVCFLGHFLAGMYVCI
jgi:hypothetical protein